MLVPSSHSGFRRAVWFVMAFYAVACGRALVPGLCATLAAAESGGGTCCVMQDTAHDGETPAMASLAAASPSCAFCALVNTLVTPPSLDATETSVPRAVAVLPIPDSPMAPQTLWNPALPRDPPAA